MPGSNARALAKGRTLFADALILDLEDAVAPDQKAQARDNVSNALAEGGYGKREIFVRINAFDTPWGRADALAVARMGAQALLIPKVESADDVRQVETVLEQAGAPKDLALWCMMETPLGVLRAVEIAASSQRLAGFVMGTSDLAKDLRCAHTKTREPLLTSLSLCLLAARAFGLAIVDGVHLDLEDDEGFAAACKQGKDLGFDGKTLIHPKTVAKANEVFAPSQDEVAWARKIIAAHAEAALQGKGVVLVDGKLIENLHVVAAQRQVALADAIDALGRG
jgi:citrate lyase subunit beta/citryl-CoA lyase